MFEHHLLHVHDVAGTQLGVPSCIHHYVWLRWTRLDIMALAPLLQSKKPDSRKFFILVQNSKLSYKYKCTCKENPVP